MTAMAIRRYSDPISFESDFLRPLKCPSAENYSCSSAVPIHSSVRLKTSIFLWPRLGTDRYIFGAALFEGWVRADAIGDIYSTLAFDEKWEDLKTLL